MHTTDFTILVPWVIDHGYLIFLIAALIEGPFVSAAGGVAAALGYYNVFFIMLLAIAGDLGGDLIYFGIGYRLHRLIQGGHLRFLGITESKMERIGKILHKHAVKAVLFVKLTPLIGAPGLMIIGAFKTSFKKMFNTSLLLAVPKSVFFVLIGYFSARAYQYLDKTIMKGEMTIAIIAAVALILYFAYQRLSAYLAKDIEKE